MFHITSMQMDQIPTIYSSTSQNGKGDPENHSCPLLVSQLFIARLFCWFVWPWANIQMRCWEFKLRVRINYSLLIHPVYLMLVFNEKCQCTVVQCSPHSPPPPADVFNFILFHAKFGSVIYNPGPGGLDRDYMSSLETWSLGLMIVYRNVTLICSMLNKTFKTPTLLDSGCLSLRYRFYNWSGFNGSFVLRRLAESFGQICRSQQQQVGDSDIHQFIYKLFCNFTANCFSHSS